MGLTRDVEVMERRGQLEVSKGIREFQLTITGLPPLFFVTADSKALTSSVFVTAESKGLIVPQFGVSVAKFESADYKGLTTLGGIRRTTTKSRRHYSYDTYYAWAALICQDISVTIKVSKT